jgi:hypothetical protein
MQWPKNATCDFVWQNRHTKSPFGAKTNRTIVQFYKETVYFWKKVVLVTEERTLHSEIPQPKQRWLDISSCHRTPRFVNEDI